MLPRHDFFVEIPEALEVPKRAHGRAAKSALRATLVDHHRRRIPEHFKTSARSKYRHKPRSKGWKARKLAVHKSRTDLVASGRTKDKFLSQFILRVGGSATGGRNKGRLEGKLIMRFPFPVRFQAEKGVSVKDMAEEISRWTIAEQRQASQLYARQYAADLQEEIRKSPRRRRRARR